MFRRSRIGAAVALVSAGLALPALAQETQRIEITGSSIKRIDADALSAAIYDRATLADAKKLVA